MSSPVTPLSSGRSRGPAEPRSIATGPAVTQSAATAPLSADAGPVVLFDGVCSLCNGAVHWVLARDHAARFRFAALQSSAARQLLAPYLGGRAIPDSLVLLDRDGLHVRSDAALRIARGLGGPWALLAVARLVPRPIRDAVYQLIARHRYRWFGREDQCFLPSPAVAARFLDAGEPR